MTARIPVVGIGADGLPGLPPASREVLESATAIHGSPRQLHLVEGLGRPLRPWPSPMVPALPALVEEIAATGAAIVASGDPMFHGIGSTLARLVGPDRLLVHPAPSSASLAAARLGWPLADLPVHSLVTADPHLVLRSAAHGARCLVLCAGAVTVVEVARVLADAGWSGSELTVLGDLGADTESMLRGTAEDFAATTTPRWSDLCLLAVEYRPGAGGLPPALGPAPGLPDEVFDTDGQLTKSTPRAVALAALRPVAGELLWDVGGGTGTIGIEWMRCAPGARAVAFERSSDRAERIRRNARRLGVPALEIVTGHAPAVLHDRTDRPDAVFVGGGAGEEDMLRTCWRALRPGGRLVAAAVTVETEILLARWHRAHGGSLSRIAVETSEPLGGFTGWTPARTVVHLHCVKPATTVGIDPTAAPDETTSNGKDRTP